MTINEKFVAVECSSRYDPIAIPSDEADAANQNINLRQTFTRHLSLRHNRRPKPVT